MSEVFDRLKTPDNLILVDPVMGDNGELYSIFLKGFPGGMRTLCTNADVIAPNITEAVLLLEEPYLEGPYTRQYIESLLLKLGTLGSKKVVLTGVYFNGEQLGATTFECTTKIVDYIFLRRIDGYFHGTGDVFAGTLLTIAKGFLETLRMTLFSMALAKEEKDTKVNSYT